MIPLPIILTAFLATCAHTKAPANNLHITVINVSGTRRQLVTNTSRLNLPLGERVTLLCHPGERLLVISDTDTHIHMQWTASAQDADRYIPIH